MAYANSIFLVFFLCAFILAL